MEGGNLVTVPLSKRIWTIEKVIKVELEPINIRGGMQEL
jgi:hypothetical protein